MLKIHPRGWIVLGAGLVVCSSILPARAGSHWLRHSDPQPAESQPVESAEPQEEESRLVPTPADPSQTVIHAAIPVDDKELPELLNRLTKVGEQAAAAKSQAEMVSLNLQQADLLDQIIARSKPEEQAALIKQRADCLIAAASSSPAGDRTAYLRLVSLEQQINQSSPEAGLAAYITFREMQTDYATRQQNTPSENMGKLQEEWRDKLVQFVQTYPRSEDTPNALMELAMVSEFMGKEPEAVRWYYQLAQDFPGTPLAAKAKGAVTRLGMEGNILSLTLPQLNSENPRVDDPFDLDQLRGKLVVVYLWASGDGRASEDFGTLQGLLSRYHDKGLEVLCVNMDKTPEEARTFLRGAAAPGIHVFQRGGLEGKVATKYGVLALPTTLVVGPDGRVLNRKVEISSLEEKLPTLLKQQVAQH